jgi:hypothetical protein
MIIPMVGMSSAIVEAVGMFRAWQDTARNVDAALKVLNAAIREFGPNSKEAAQAAKELE